MSRPEILLFYDGFELRAVDGFSRVAREQARRAARFVYKTARRGQTKTGFYTAFAMLRTCLEQAGCRVKVNDFAAARRSPATPIGVLGYSSVLEKLDGLPNPRLLGPGLFSSPLECPDLFSDPRNVLYLQSSEWVEALFAPWFTNRQRRWFAGLDLDRIPANDGTPKPIDVLIYDKIYFDRDAVYDRTIGKFRDLLDRHNLCHTTIRYGQYYRPDYLRSLRSSRCMAFFSHSETQGIAYQECLAMNVPVFAWDEGVWPNPMARQISDQPIPSTSVPYFDERCGRRFTMASMEADWARFLAMLPQFSPRRFVSSELSAAKSARLYLHAYSEVGAAHRLGGDTGSRIDQRPAGIV
ncbi:MAG: glycosyltransferase [Hyphomicrobiaceae bacterium]|nr:glycosyltransferase [Hyphomicrobiaceae bacterium]